MISGEWQNDLFPALQELLYARTLNRLTHSTWPLIEMPVQHPDDLVKAFVDILVGELLPRSMVIDGMPQPAPGNLLPHPGENLALNLLDQYQVEMELPSCATSLLPSYWKAEFNARKQGLAFFLESHFAFLHRQWKKKKEQRESGRKAEAGQLLRKLQDYAGQLEEITAFHLNLKNQLELLQSELEQVNHGPRHSDFAFFKNTTGWVIRYEGELINVKGNPRTGLSYLHKLLKNPGRKFNPQDLEVFRQTKQDDAQLIEITGSIAVEVDSMYANLNPEDENELLDSVRRLSEQLPEPTDSLEDQILIYSQMVYLTHTLKEIRSKASYIDLYEYYQEKLDDLIYLFEKNTQDKAFVRKVLKKSGVIKKTANYKVQIRRQTQRVRKAIENAIEKVESAEFVDYLNKTVTLGRKSCYHPLHDDPIDWQLHPEE